MKLVLRPGLSWCICAEQAVFADLARDRYLCLPESLERAFQRWAAGGDIGADAEQALVEAGVLEPGDGARAACAWHRPPRHDHPAEAARTGQWRSTLSAVIGQLRARFWLRHRTMADIVALLARERMCAPRGTQGEARSRQLVAAFGTSSTLLRAADQCLPRAIAAWRLCRRGGIDAALILGVRLDPFAAHSWVQTGDAVLVGDFERARLYTPILVLR
jgi:hypothetical protein